MASLSDWLMESPAWITHRIRVDLLEQSEPVDQVQVARAAMVADLALQLLINDLDSWPGQVIKSHKATLFYRKRAFLIDVGFRKDDSDIQPVVECILTSQAPEGPFTVPINIPKVFGGDAADH